eukprot:6199282-Pleurochrysis_carterae.AAC.1
MRGWARLRAVSGRGRRGRRNPKRRGRARARYTCDASARRQMCMRNKLKGARRHLLKCTSREGQKGNKRV